MASKIKIETVKVLGLTLTTASMLFAAVWWAATMQTKMDDVIVVTKDIPTMKIDIALIKSSLVKTVSQK